MTNHLPCIAHFYEPTVRDTNRQNNDNYKMESRKIARMSFKFKQMWQIIET